LADLEEVFDPPLTFSSLVAPSCSSSPIVTTTSDSTLLDFPFPLAQYTSLEVGETSRSDVRTLEDASLFRSKELALVEPHLEEPCGDIVMGTDTRSSGPTAPIGKEPLELYLISSPLPSAIASHLHTFHKSLGDIQGYHPSLDSYCAYLVDLPRKITWCTFFTNIFDFSMAFTVFKRPLTFIDLSCVVPSYLHHSEVHASTYNKLLRALTASEWSDLSLDVRSD